MCRDQEVILQDNLEGQVDSKPVLSMLHHMRDRRLDLEETVVHHSLDGDTFPFCIKLAPARHAVDIHLELSARQLIELIPCPALFLFHLTPNTEVPGGSIEMWHRAVVQHGKFQGE